MAPPCHAFPASQLPRKVQQDVHGRRRKLQGGAPKVELDACELLQMLQYNCEVQRPLTSSSPVQCFSVQRLFRRCNDRKSSFLVETTAWEGKQEHSLPKKDDLESDKSNAADKPPSRPHQWSSNWHDADSAP